MEGASADMAINDEVVALAKRNLARQRGIPPEKIVLQKIEAVTWQDASLGCPETGRVYAQMVIPGYRLLLSDGTADFEYHTDNHLRVILYRKNEQSEIE